MKRLHLYLPFLCILSGSLNAQHCQFDNANILVVHITSETDSAVIPDLKITILDPLGYTVMTDKWNGNEWVNDTLKLWQNPSKTSHSGIIDNNNPMNPWSIRFWFAEDDYVLVAGGALPGYRLKIEDTDGELNGGAFQTIEVDLLDIEFYQLCTGVSDWDRGEEYGFVENYQPIRVELKTQ